MQMEVKSICDSDNRYDLLFLGKVHGLIDNLFADFLGLHFPSLQALWFIEREGRTSYPWAEEWTKRVYEWGKKLTRTHLLSDAEVTGARYGFTPLYTMNLPETLDFPFPESVFLQIPKGKTVTITYLENSHDVDLGGFHRLRNQITCYHRIEKEYSAPQDADLFVELNSAAWLLNSCVITGAALLVDENGEEIPETQKKLILYDFLQNTLDALYNSLNITNCQLLTGVTATVNTELETGVIVNNFGTGTVQVNSEKIIWSAPLFQAIPENFHYAYLETPTEREGREPFLIYYEEEKSFEISFVPQKIGFFEKWREGIVETLPYGYDISTPAGLGQGTEVMRVDYPTVIGENPISFITLTDNQQVDYPWFNFSGNGFDDIEVTSYPLLDKNDVPPTFEPSLNDRFISGDGPSYIKGGHLFKFRVDADGAEVWYQSSIYYFWRPSAHFVHSGGAYYRYTFAGIPFVGEDYNLFSSSEWGLIRNSMDISAGKNKVISKQAVRVTVDAENVREPIIAHIVENNQAQVGEILPFVIYFNNYGFLEPNLTEVSQGMTLYRTLRIQHIAPSNLFYTSEGDLIEISAAQMQSILDKCLLPPDYSPGADNQVEVNFALPGGYNFYLSFTKPYFDPDPDNGDIMPDSKRVIETLFYIEDMHRFLGCTALPDGSWRSFPQPRPFSGPEGIPEGWQFYTANEDGAGIYQKRSRLIEADDFGRPVVKPAGYVQCYNLLQRLECAQDDLTNQLGGDEATGFLLPTADGKFLTCTSLFNVMAQSAYTISQLAYGVNQLKVQSRQILSMVRDTLRGLGIPLRKKVLYVDWSKGKGQTWVPAITEQGPTVSSQIGIVLANLSMVVAQGMKLMKLDK